MMKVVAPAIALLGLTCGDALAQGASQSTMMPLTPAGAVRARS